MNFRVYNEQSDGTFARDVSVITSGSWEGAVAQIEERWAQNFGERLILIEENATWDAARIFRIAKPKPATPIVLVAEDAVA